MENLQKESTRHSFLLYFVERGTDDHYTMITLNYF